jgi:LysM repeat protein
MARTRLFGALAAPAALLAAAVPASAAVPHTVMPGETLWSIAAASNFTTHALAAYNGLADDASVYAGETIQVPSEAEAASAVASAPSAAPATSASGASTSTAPAPASGGEAHTVVPGESLWSIAAANGIPEATLAEANGLSPDALLIIGQSVTVPGASTTAAPVSSTTAPASPSASVTSSSGISLAPIPAASGTVYLRSDAAQAWNAMRQASLSELGVDLYPEGPLGAYRTYDQQAQLYQAYLDGTGAPADPPGTSSHELGTAVDVATPEMRSVIDQIGAGYGWGKVHGPGEWWHVDYLGG